VNDRASGFSLVEILVAFALLGVGLLTVAPMFVYGTKRAASSADLGTTGSAAVMEMERLRSATFATLIAGGSLASNVASYSDTTTNPAVQIRWTIADDTSPVRVKTITVLAIARRAVAGNAKQVQLTTQRSK
jgi:Tfp pilus assembly protein PilV